MSQNTGHKWKWIDCIESHHNDVLEIFRYFNILMYKKHFNYFEIFPVLITESIQADPWSGGIWTVENPDYSVLA